jgi:hypothetical protein
MAKSLLMVFGGPTTPEHEEEVLSWYDQHLEEMCSLPGVTAAHLYRPSSKQFPRTTADLPQTLAVYEYDTIDLPAAIEALDAARTEGRATGRYEAGRALTAPPEGAITPHPNYQSAYYNLVSRSPRDTDWTLGGQAIFMVFGGPTKPSLYEEIMRWYIDGHLEHICSLHGVASGQLLRPSSAQLPEANPEAFPGVMAFYDYDTDDLAASIDAAWGAHLEGMKRGEYEPGVSIPGPVPGVWKLDPKHQSAYYELVTRWPKR